jgi:hypothetical protein
VVVTVRRPSSVVDVAEALAPSAPDRDEARTELLAEDDPELRADTEAPAEPWPAPDRAFGRRGGVTVLDPSAAIRTTSQSSSIVRSGLAAPWAEPAPIMRTAAMEVVRLRMSTPRGVEGAARLTLAAPPTS